MATITINSTDLQEGDRLVVGVAQVTTSRGGVQLTTADGLTVTVPKGEITIRRRSGGNGAGAGGHKGQAVLDVLKRAKKPLSAAEVAEKAGCSQGRVYEVARATPAVEQPERGVFVLSA
jgi:hypothetical protein